MTLRDTKKQRAIEEVWDELIAAEFYEPSQSVEGYKKPEHSQRIEEALEALGLDDKLSTKQIKGLEKLIRWCRYAARSNR